jgi:hypothetical protein
VGTGTTFDVAMTLHAATLGRSHGNAFGVRSRWSFRPGVSTRRRHPRLSTNTPSAWCTRRPAPRPNREAIPVDSRGSRRFAAPPVMRPKDHDPEGVAVGTGTTFDVAMTLHAATSGRSHGNAFGVRSRLFVSSGVSTRRRHPRLSTNTPSAWCTRRPAPRPDRTSDEPNTNEKPPLVTRAVSSEAFRRRRDQ